MTNFEALFSPIKIASMELKNRLAMAPMTVDFANPDETPSDQQIAYYAERARGGVGLIGLEVCTVDKTHRYQQRSLGLYHDDLIAGHKKLVDAIHAHGAKVQPQIAHTGPESLSPFYEGKETIGASVIRTQTTKQVCREATIEEIEAIIEMFGDAARRAREAGYDGIELHSAHSYMFLGSFLSPLRNMRQDAYAGHKFEGRTKLLFQVLENIRGKAGSDFPITLRLSGFERESGGREINDTQRLAPMLEAAGVNCLHVSGGVGNANITQIVTGAEYRPGYNLAAATALKSVVDIPVMVVGQNNNLHFAESIIENGQADLVVIGRGLLADPQLPNKARQGKLASITPCTLCQDCIDSMMSLGAGVKCAVNPRCGRELAFVGEKAGSIKNVVVIGGGPGGLVAAKTAADRGHRVTLIEKSTALGGAFARASEVFPPNKAFLDNLIDGVQSLPSIVVKLGELASVEKVKALNPDAIIVATGARVVTADIAGIEGDHVIRGEAVKQLIDSMADTATTDSLSDSVVIIGASLMGMELAETIAKRGKRVHLLETGPRFASPAGKKRRGDHAKRLDLLGVPLNTGITIDEITRSGVAISTVNGKQCTIDAGSVVVVGDYIADTRLFESMQSLAAEVHAVGDCTGFGLSKKAVDEAMTIASRL